MRLFLPFLLAFLLFLTRAAQIGNPETVFREQLAYLQQTINSGNLRALPKIINLGNKQSGGMIVAVYRNVQMNVLSAQSVGRRRAVRIEGLVQLTLRGEPGTLVKIGMHKSNPAVSLHGWIFDQIVLVPN
ncbi:unnamed protein product [Caenorhabditis sp. 36 PRJEB53466]|nr:unnamed protein product [Caenorhabditis sp. 36 PRJEB53466]